jgi:hypothetical protein
MPPPWKILLRKHLVFPLSHNGNHHRVAAKVVSKIERGRSATSVHGFVLAVFRARAQRSGARARARSSTQLYHSIPVNALLGQEFGNGGNE